MNRIFVISVILTMFFSVCFIGASLYIAKLITGNDYHHVHTEKKPENAELFESYVLEYLDEYGIKHPNFHYHYSEDSRDAIALTSCYFSENYNGDLVFADIPCDVYIMPCNLIRDDLYEVAIHEASHIIEGSIYGYREESHGFGWAEAMYKKGFLNPETSKESSVECT